MPTPARGALRWGRSAALAVATVGLAATAHVLAGGEVPGLAAMSVLGLVVALVCVVVTGRQRGIPAITATMAALQVVLHEGFMLLTPMGVGHDGCAHALSGHLQHSTGALQSLCGASLAVPGHQMGTSPTMLLAHGIAVVLLSAALARGETALWLLGRLAAPCLPTAPACPAPRTASVTEAPVARLTGRASARSILRRGPPTPRCTALV